MNHLRIIKTSLATLIITALSLLVDFVMGEPGNSEFYTLLLFANFLICLNLGLLTVYSNHNKIKLIAVLSLILWSVNRLSGVIETIIFNLTSINQAMYILGSGLLYAVVASTLVVILLNPLQQVNVQIERHQRSIPGWIFRLILADIVYLVFYLIAGGILMAVYPELIQFYDGKMPAFETIVKTQVFIRAPLYIMVAIMILQLSRGSRAFKSMLIGVTLAIMGAVSPLMLPNEFLPFNIRMVHLVEMGISNLGFGVVIGIILGLKTSIKDPRPTFPTSASG